MMKGFYSNFLTHKKNQNKKKKSVHTSHISQTITDLNENRKFRKSNLPLKALP